MKIPAHTIDEPERQAALDTLSLIYSPAEERFDRITSLAAKLFDVPYALISLVSRDIQWFKSSCGLDADQTPRSISFCGHAIHQDDAFIVTDASQAPDFADNPLVTGPPHIRFYAGQPIAFQGRHIGTLCIIGTEPREMSEGDKISLRQLAGWVENELSQQLPGSLQSRFLASLDEAQRAPLIDAEAASWNTDGMQRLLEDQLQSPTAPALFARLKPSNRLTNDNDSGLLKRLATQIRGLSSSELILAHHGAGEWLLFQGDCDRATADLLLQRLCRVLSGSEIYSQGGAPESWHAVALQGMPAMPIDWTRMLHICGQASDVPVRLLDWA